MTVENSLVGVIADTHGLFDLAVRRYFRGGDHILHARDIGERSVTEQLGQILRPLPFPVMSMGISTADFLGRPWFVGTGGRSSYAMCYMRWGS